jgi:predicted pyridoxine 5'-phosphate oxidase superfamily flavin-nucleotide-binding protein
MVSGLQNVTGFHDGELAVQDRAGVRAQAARLAGMLARPTLDGGKSAFLAERDFAVIAGRDEERRLWTSPLFAEPGFLDAHDTTLQIHAIPADGDPLSGMPPGQPIGLLAIEFATRRRMRINGTLTRTDGQGLDIAVEQAYGNCPQYIQQRHLEHTDGAKQASQVSRAKSLAVNDIEQISRADTFFLGTAHPTRGADASHRGGSPGFVRIEGDTLWWPDYPGNNMFNSLGNLAVDDTAALLFVDFDSGRTIQLSGTASVEWTQPGARGDDGMTGRRVRFGIEHVATAILDLRSDRPVLSPYNPPIS